MRIKKILIPTDGSPLANGAARAAIALAQQLDAETIGIYVAPEFLSLMYGEAIALQSVTEDEYRSMEQKAGGAFLSEIGAAAQTAAVKFSGHVVYGNSPAQEIVKAAARHNCDLIFIGSHGRGGLGQLLLGSVTTKIMSSCDKPVLVYRAPHA